MLCQPNSLRGIALAFRRKSIFVKVARRLYGSLSTLPALLDGSLSNSFLLLLQPWQCLQGKSKVSAEKGGLPHQFVVRCIGGKYETIGNGLVVADQALLVKESLLSFFCPSSSNKQKHFYNFPANFSSGNTRAGANLLSPQKLGYSVQKARRGENSDNIIRGSSKTTLFVFSRLVISYYLY